MVKLNNINYIIDINFYTWRVISKFMPVKTRKMCLAYLFIHLIPHVGLNTCTCNLDQFSVVGPKFPMTNYNS